MSRLIDMADRIIIPGPGINGASEELTPLQLFAKKVEDATNEVCRASVPVPFVMGILYSVATEVKFNAQMALMQEQAVLAARAIEEAAKIKPN